MSYLNEKTYQYYNNPCYPKVGVMLFARKLYNKDSQMTVPGTGDVISLWPLHDPCLGFRYGEIKEVTEETITIIDQFGSECVLDRKKDLIIRTSTVSKEV